MQRLYASNQELQRKLSNLEGEHHNELLKVEEKARSFELRNKIDFQSGQIEIKALKDKISALEAKTKAAEADLQSKLSEILTLNSNTMSLQTKQEA